LFLAETQRAQRKITNNIPLRSWRTLRENFKQFLIIFKFIPFQLPLSEGKNYGPKLKTGRA